MLKVHTDFNSRTPENDHYPVLYYNGKKVVEQIDTLNLKKGDKIILYQDEDDFEVIATLDFITGRWVATPDWSTKKLLSKSLG